MGKAIIVPDVNWASKNFGTVSIVELIITGATTIYGEQSYSAYLKGAPVSATWTLSGSAASLSSQVGSSVTLTPVSDGLVTLSATYNGVTESVEITVYEGVVLTSISGQEWLDEKAITLTAISGGGVVLPATFSTNDNSLVSLSDNGAGTATITAAANGIGGIATISATFWGVTVTKTISVYVMAGLAFHLDGADATASAWKDRKANIEFALTNCTPQNGGVLFNGSTSKGVNTKDNPSLGLTSPTIEFVVQPLQTPTASKYILFGRTASTSVKIPQCYYYLSGDKMKAFTNSGQATQATPFATKAAAAKTFVQSISMSGNVADGSDLTYDSSTNTATSDHSAWALGHNDISADYTFYGYIFNIRIYKNSLTAAQMKHNQGIDALRYGITINE